MSLREEITSLVYDDMGIEPDIRISKIINKVLDAAVDTQEKQIWHIKADKYVAIEAIQRLKEGK